MVGTDTKNIYNYINSEVLECMLSAYDFTAVKYIEDNGSVTLSLDQIDLAEYGENEDDALTKMAKGIIEYAEHYCQQSWWLAINRKAHAPYVARTLFINDVEKIKELIVCRLGEI